VVTFSCEEIQQEQTKIKEARKKEEVSIQVPCKVRKNDKVYVVQDK